MGKNVVFKRRWREAATYRTGRMEEMLDIEKPVSEQDPRDREDRRREKRRNRWKYAVSAVIVLVLLVSGGILARRAAEGESSVEIGRAHG